MSGRTRKSGSITVPPPPGESAEPARAVPKCGAPATPSDIQLGADIFRCSRQPILITDLQGNTVDVNEAFTEVTGYTRAEVLGRNPRLMKSDRHDAAFYRQMWQELVKTGGWQGEVWDRRKSGETYPKWLSISTLRDASGKSTHYLGMFSDITPAKRNEEQLERLAHYDAVTGLPNRVLFRDRLRQALAQARRSGRMIALLFLDLDGFKGINDRLGHRVGDLLLHAVGRRLSELLRETDTVARLAGDEFVVVLSEMPGMGDVALVAHKLVQSFARAFRLDDQEVSLTASVGVALFPHDGDDVDGLLKNADAAMYNAKGAGRNTYRFFSREMQAKAQREVALENDLRQAVEEEGFHLHYQPRVEATTGKVRGAEALLRWKNPQGNTVPPSKFVPVAEQTRLIVPLGLWVLRTACRQARQWLDLGLPPVRVSVNVSAVQFERRELVNEIGQVLIDAGLRPGQLEVELTESLAMRNPEITIETLLELRSMGVRASIDDFGTGYSSLSYLKRFPIDALKIDRSFVRDLGDDPDAAVVVQTIIGLAHSLGLTVVAEGVETVRQLDFLLQHACDEIQGFLLAKPQPADRLAELLRADRSLLPG